MLQAHEMSVKRQAHVVRMAFDDEVLSVIDLPKGALRLTRGPGSGLARRVGDPPGTFWAIGDRGPNMKIELAVGRYGLHHLEPFAALDTASTGFVLDMLEDAATHRGRAWVLAHYEAPGNLPLASMIDLGD